MLSPYGEWKEHGNCELLIDCWKMEDKNGRHCKVYYTLFNFHLNQSLPLIHIYLFLTVLYIYDDGDEAK
jgi:hypothetical protein